jgi:hypothetical protein
MVSCLNVGSSRLEATAGFLGPGNGHCASRDVPETQDSPDVSAHGVNMPVDRYTVGRGQAFPEPGCPQPTRDLNASQWGLG